MWNCLPVGERHQECLGRDKQHPCNEVPTMEWMNATWKKWHLSFNECTVLHEGHCYRSRNLSTNVYHILIDSLGKWSLCKVDSTCAKWWPNSHVCSCHHSSEALEKWRQWIPWSHCNSSQVTDAIISPSAEMTECWRICFITKERKLQSTVRVLWKSCTSNSSAKTDSWFIIQHQLVPQSTADITGHSSRMRQNQLFAVNN